MSYSKLTEIEALVEAAGLDLDALSLIVSEALDEDLGGRGVLPPGAGAGLDITSYATVPAGDTAHGRFVVRQPGTVAGLPVAAYTVASVCSAAGDFELSLHATEGDRVARGDVLIAVDGNARALLAAERVALNLITMMSGVATATRAWVDALAGSNTQVRDSRKTIPGLRMLQKYAVRIGGGINHRMSLADAALIKDNHVIAARGVVPAYRAVRQAFPDVPIEVEVTSAEQAHQVVSAGATEILLDNMTAAEMAAIVAELGSRATFEASGGLRIENATEVAQTGVNFLAVGAITHSVLALDIALDFASEN
ncbi:MAG TPA: carboxylating nicotinate-nucleotide diphosphorylase [Propionibacteriaceae bacterium]|nr:carboxylating nicotinate-nucleotide diphosphorylase [Propionibacteriaceae bacterium]